MRDRRGVVVPLALVLAVTGCTISSTADPVKQGDGLVAGSNWSGAIEPPLPMAASRPEQLVQFYFDAAVGGGAEGAERVRAFLTADARGRWVPGQVLTVVRILNIGLGEVAERSASVQVRYQRVGVLKEGTVEPSNDQSTVTTVTLRLESDGTSNHWQVSNPPQGMLLSDSALGSLYLARPIYFWDNPNQVLVPDLRYLPLTMPVDQRPGQIVDWLLAGASPWLSPTVTRSVPAGTAKIGNVVHRRNTVVVNLSARAGADAKDLQRFVDQTRWSLRSISIDSPVELQIEGQRKEADGSSDGYLQANASYVLQNLEPSQYGVVKGKVAVLPEISDMSPAPALLAPVNTKVVSAALSGDGTLGAFVRRSAAGWSLALVTTAADGTVIHSDTVDLGRAATVSRPVWIPGTDQVFIAVNGGLRVMSATGQSARITPSTLTGITSVGVAPDGRRVGLVAHGRAYVGALILEGSAVSVGPQLREITPPGRLIATAIAWSSGHEVIVAGKEGENPVLWKGTADGAYVRKRTLDSAGYTLTDVVAFPDGQDAARTGSEVIVQAGARGSYYVFNNNLKAISGGVSSAFYRY